MAFSPETFALLSKKINGIASNVVDVRIGADNKSIVIEKLDGTTFQVQIPNPVLTYQICNKLSVDANNKLCYDGQLIDTDTMVNGLTFNQTTKELKITLNDGQEFKTIIPIATTIDDGLSDFFNGIII